MRFTLLAIAALALTNVAYAAPAATIKEAINHRDITSVSRLTSNLGYAHSNDIARRAEADEDEGDEDVPPPPSASKENGGKPKGSAPPPGGASAGGGKKKEEEEKDGAGLPTDAVTGALGGITKGLPTTELLAGGLPAAEGIAGGLPINKVTGIATGPGGAGLPLDTVAGVADGVTGSGLPTDKVASLAGGGLPTDSLKGVTDGLPLVNGVTGGL